MTRTNGFVLNHDKSLRIYFFFVKRQAKKNFKNKKQNKTKQKKKQTKKNNKKTHHFPKYVESAVIKTLYIISLFDNILVNELLIT